jgi:hypothetical protein
MRASAKEPAKVHRGLSLGQSLAIVIGGIAGGVAGWFFAEQEVVRITEKAGRSLRADNRGPMLLGYLLIGWLAGTFASYFLVKLSRPRHRENDET